MAKKFVEEFDIELTADNGNITDYEAFENKELLDSLRNRIIEGLIDRNLEELSIFAIREEVDRVVEGYDISIIERSFLYNLIDNEVNGYGPITELLNDKHVTEIMVNGKDEVYIEIDGKIVKDNTVSFINEEHIIRTIQRLIQPLGRTIDTANPMVDARLEDGSRLNAVIAPLSLKGPVLTIRKFTKEMATIEDFLRNGAITPYMARFLEACVKAKLNMVISGGTGAGKTTLLNILSSFVGTDERVITIEEAAELQLKQEHVISLETRNPNYEGEGEISIRDLVINALHMRPDRIIVGEVRGKEAFDMLQAMNTGHEGSMTTMHANGCPDALNRLETMILMAGMEIPVRAIRDYIRDAINVIVHIERLSDGKRRVTSISEVVGMENDEIVLREIFAFEKKGVNESGDVMGEFVLRPDTPEVYKKMKTMGINDLKDIFGE